METLALLIAAVVFAVAVLETVRDRRRIRREREKLLHRATPWTPPPPAKPRIT